MQDSASPQGENQILAGYIPKAKFAKEINKSERTVDRLIDQKNGLPHLKLGRDVFIPIDLARQWLADRVTQCNPTNRSYRSSRKAA